MIIKIDYPSIDARQSRLINSSTTDKKKKKKKCILVLTKSCPQKKEWCIMEASWKSYSKRTQDSWQNRIIEFLPVDVEKFLDFKICFTTDKSLVEILSCPYSTPDLCSKIICSNWHRPKTSKDWLEMNDWSSAKTFRL